MSYFLTLCLSFWGHDILFDTMTYFLYFWTLCRTFWHHDVLFDSMTYFLHIDVFYILSDVIAYFLMSWSTFLFMTNCLTLCRTFWRDDVFFRRHDISSVLFDVMMCFFMPGHTFWHLDILSALFVIMTLLHTSWGTFGRSDVRFDVMAYF